MVRHWMVALAACGILASWLLARPGIVTTRTGQTYEGEVTERDNVVEIVIKGVTLAVSRDDVAKIEYTGDINQQFQDRLAKLEKDDVKGHVELARWAFEKDQFKLARQALEQALRINPNDSEAATLLETVIRTERLAARSNGQAARTETQVDRPQGEQVTTSPGAPDRGRLLTAEDINSIRLMELRANDRVSVQIPQETRNRYASIMRLERRQVNAMRPLELALLIRDNAETQSLRSEVRVLGDPQAMAEYRRIQRVILSGCAASGCHSGTTGGNLILFTPADNDATTYTNFYILSHYMRQVEDSQVEGGLFSGPAQRRVIDRDQPENSLLLQYGLPQDTARHPHPPTPGFRAIFPNRQSTAYVQIRDWISNGLRRPTPDYGITYQPPTSQPDAAEQAEEQADN